MSNKDLKPLSKEDSEKFATSRQSDAVVQHKCSSCAAWYETNRLQQDFIETFKCDCGNRISYPVPKMETRSQILLPSNDDILFVADADMKLDSGMTVKEAVERACHWWGTIGQKEMQTQLKRQSSSVGGVNNGSGAAFASNDVDDPNFLPSGVIKGLPWDALGKREKLMIVKIWHHFQIRKPDVLGEENSGHKMQERGKIQ